MDYKEKVIALLDSQELSDEQKRKLEEIFPELKESEDERIRKELLNYLYDVHDDDEERARWIAWLEKQGKNNMGISEATKQELEDNLNKALEKETQKSCNEFLDELVEQKPAWSEDDETALGDALWCCKQAASIAKDENDMGNIWYAENWLKSLKDRVHPEQEWSEEDYNEIETIACHLDNIDNESMAEVLRNIRDKYYSQSHWKPSAEQMDMLKIAVSTSNSIVLDSLYNDLEKLKG